MAFDIILEIFSWLPAKTIFKLAAVCKEANHLLWEDFFVEKQYHHSLIKSNDHDSAFFFLQPNNCQSYTRDNFELHPLHAANYGSGTASLPRKSLEFLKKGGRVLASSNGLLCCRNLSRYSRGCLFLCNPATQTWLSIPSPSGLDHESTRDINIVFECDKADYMFLMLESDTSEWASNFQLKVYLPEEGIWKENELVNFGARNINLESPVYHNGAVHYVSDCGAYLTKASPFYWPYVVCLSLEDGSVKFLRVPKSSRKGLHDMNCRLGIFKWGSDNSSTTSESICLVKLARKRCCVWVLADYDSSSWTLILKRRVQAMGFIEDSPIVSGFTVLNGESLLLATDERVYSYNLASGNNGKVELISSHECRSRHLLFHSYSSTLRPCGRGEATVPDFGF